VTRRRHRRRQGNRTRQGRRLQAARSSVNLPRVVEL
jgi:hypothetical protein